MVSVAVRVVVPVNAGTENVAAPAPVPLAVLSVSQVGAPVTAQEQPLCADTVTTPPPPTSVNVRALGVIAYVQVTGASCVIENVWPPMVRAAARPVGPGLDATLKPTEPGPLPLAAVTMTQLALLVAVHPQPLLAFTVTLPPPPPAVNPCELLPSAIVQL